MTNAKHAIYCIACAGCLLIAETMFVIDNAIHQKGGSAITTTLNLSESLNRSCRQLEQLLHTTIVIESKINHHK